jgi:hypothetical protein
MKYIILLFFGLNISSFTPVFSDFTPHNMVEKMGGGINLGNVFSAPVVGNWSPDC